MGMDQPRVGYTLLMALTIYGRGVNRLSSLSYTERAYGGGERGGGILPGGSPRRSYPYAPSRSRELKYSRSRPAPGLVLYLGSS